MTARSASCSLPPCVQFKAKPIPPQRRSETRVERLALVVRVNHPYIASEDRYQIVDEYARIERSEQASKLASLNPEVSERAHAAKRTNDKIGYQVCTNAELAKAKEKGVFFFKILCEHFKNLKARQINPNKMLKDPDEVVAENQVRKVAALYLYEDHFLKSQQLRLSRERRRIAFEEHEKVRQNEFEERILKINERISQLVRKDVVDILASKEKQEQ